MKIKDILMIISGIAFLLLIIYFSFISPIIDGISKHGVFGFVAEVVCGILFIYFIYSMTHNNRT